MAHLGWSIRLGDINNDGSDDLVVSKPFILHDVGGVFVYASCGTGDILVELQGTQIHERFGGNLAVLDFDGSGTLDVLVAAPRYEIDGTAFIGAINFFTDISP